MLLRLFALLALLQAAACMPDDWLRGRDGGCQILVSNRHGEGGMMGSGYAPCDGSFAFCTEQPTPVGENSWRIPVSAQHSGWFVTAETGEISGGGEASEGCPEFRWHMGGATDDVVWTAPGPGVYRIEAAFADVMGVVSYYGHDLAVAAAGGNTSAPLA